MRNKGFLDFVAVLAVLVGMALVSFVIPGAPGVVEWTVFVAWIVLLGIVSGSFWLACLAWRGVRHIAGRVRA